MLRIFNNIFLYLYDSFLNLIYLNKCLLCSCSKTDDYLCKNCLKDIKFLSSFPHRFFNSIPIYSCFIYEDKIKKLIHLLKFKHKKSSAKALALLMFSYFKKLDFKKDFIIVYPPSFFIKSLTRGYKHMELIAKYFSKYTNFPVEHNLIKKVKYTKPQYEVKNRHLNIKNSFSLNKKLTDKYKDKNILLIDDITTSGATLEEIINLFLKNGINNITCLTISKAK